MSLSRSNSTVQPAVSHSDACSVSIIIKALNEERRIATTIETALAAVAPFDGEVVLADSCSTDDTIKLAQRYPIRIVQLQNAGERCCGIGPQLGYQHSSGRYVYILDGDMEMQTGFLGPAIAFLQDHPDVAGVGGKVLEQNIESLEYVARTGRKDSHMQPGEVDRLDMGGLYRRSAIEAVGYFSDRNLHSYEEFDLAVRLRERGWRLWRLPIDSAKHYGHDSPPYQLLQRRWRTRYICGTGELMRAAGGQTRLHLVVTGLREIRLYIAVLMWWVVLASIVFWPISIGAKLIWFGLLLVLPVVTMAARKRSLSEAVYSVVSWGYNAAGLVRGLMSRRRPAQEKIASIVIKEPNSSKGALGL